MVNCKYLRQIEDNKIQLILDYNQHKCRLSGKKKYPIHFSFEIIIIKENNICIDEALVKLTKFSCTQTKVGLSLYSYYIRDIKPVTCK